jgi:GTPase SAR1 family protein
MGQCAINLANENEEERLSRELDKRGRIDAASGKAVNKFLLLGAGESGKSTLFKQLNHIYGKGYSPADRMPFISTIFKNTVASMKTLVREALARGITRYGTREIDCSLPDELSDSVDYFTDISINTRVTEEAAGHIKKLWAAKGIQNVFKLRSDYQLPDAVEYLFDRVDAFVDPNYCPTYDDILRSRVRTTGIVETTFSIQNATFRILDVGGQRFVCLLIG